MNEFEDNFVFFCAEFIGTALLVFNGCMGCISTDIFPNNLVQIAFSFGLTILIIVQGFAHISGAHLNPAITLSAVIYEKKTPIVGCIYITAQLLGAVCGYALLLVLAPPNVIMPFGAKHALCVTAPSPSVSTMQAFGIEFMITSMLTLLACSVWDTRNAKNTDGIAVKFGLTITCLIMSSGNLTGGSMNPARSFGPAFWNGDFTSHWIYWIAPLGASAFTTLIYVVLFKTPLSDDSNDD